MCIFVASQFPGLCLICETDLSVVVTVAVCVAVVSVVVSLQANFLSKYLGAKKVGSRLLNSVL